MELWHLYVKLEHPLHKTHIRGEKLKDGEYHLVIHIWTFSKGKLLITKRHPSKPYGNLWEVTGGSVIANETAVEGAKRELKEETGIDCEEDELFLCTTKIEGHCIFKSFIHEKNIRIEDVICQENETIDARLVSYEEWLKMLEKGLVASPIQKHYQKYKNQLNQYFRKEQP